MNDERQPHEEFVSVTLLRAEVGELRTDVAELTRETKELVDAWKAAGKLVAFVKWISTIVTALGILWVFIGHWWKA